jgi:toxin FitB
MFLLDTNVVSETRKPKPHGGVMSWLDAQESNTLYISAMTIGELQRGVEVTREQDKNKAAEIESWLEQIAASGQLLALDATVCREWARMMHSQSDTLHELTVVTRNVRDFKALGVATLNPFAKVV